ncbi:MAG: peptide-methionine (R)-S-oxide reductase MsrB [Limimaricola sp.]|uniref:peptide-methionine (R)-S-oxide reductase MsrB n=1 Tax=Limimaricola sp. TaxID=2211665 RepID=UPI001D728598|nr:peptide-methionine (R)-S-oxide reductase MsrB [Limimaricola sp.]MBI1418552.1 peptide-methionine (R)-S-oxide reductase MsrB [Limimaricola sp.]
MNRRNFIMTGAIAALMPATLRAETFEVTHTEAEWRSILGPDAFAVMRQHKTEAAHSSPLDKNYAPGVYLCRGCELPLYSSAAKFDSGTGWPSFTRPLPDAVGTMPDDTWFTRRTEVHCRRCGGHLGHVFDDGPQPTGKRYCMNGIALVFKPA